MTSSVYDLSSKKARDGGKGAASGGPAGEVKDARKKRARGAVLIAGLTR